jgi:hypothetical protein
MPLGRATAIVPPVIHVIWMADSSVLWPHSSSNQTLALKKTDPLLFGKLSRSARFFYFKK